MDVSVIIVNYNTAVITLNCIESIYKYTKDINIEIIVIDNCSSDESVKRIKNEYPKVQLICNSENIGFGKANNLGIKQAKGKYILFLNSDTVLLNNAVKILFDFMESNNKNETIGAIGCVMFDTYMRPNFRNSFYNFPSIKMLYKELFKDIFKINNNYLKTNKILSEKGKLSIDFIVGADLFIPMQVLNNIGVFDPNFFLYWEEVDLQYRMHQNNLIRYIIDGPKIIHLEGGSSKKIIKNWQRIINAASLIYYIRKHYSILSIIFIKIYFFIYMLPSFKNRNYNINEQIIYLKSIINDNYNYTKNLST